MWVPAGPSLFLRVGTKKLNKYQSGGRRADVTSCVVVPSQVRCGGGARWSGPLGATAGPAPPRRSSGGPAPSGPATAGSTATGPSAAWRYVDQSQRHTVTTAVNINDRVSYIHLRQLQRMQLWRRSIRTWIWAKSGFWKTEILDTCKKKNTNGNFIIDAHPHRIPTHTVIVWNGRRGSI